MLPNERDAITLDLLQRNGSVTVTDIVTHCNCSVATVRRDFGRLADRGLLRRIHGGALWLDSSAQSPIEPGERSLWEARTALVDRVDVLITTPSKTTSMQLLEDRACRNGVPIVAESLPTEKAETVVAIDDYRAGLELGRWVGCYARENMGEKATVLDIGYDFSNTQARSQGFAAGLQDVLRGNLTLHRINGQGLRLPARQVAADALAIHPDINIIFGVNDDSALAGLDAYREAGLDESSLLLVPFGMEGNTTKDLLEQAGPCQVGLAMFPELVGRACIDAAICAYHGCALPQRTTTPWAIVTPQTLERYYCKDYSTGDWLIRWKTVTKLDTGNAYLQLLGQCSKQPRPKRLGTVQIFSSHDWYQNLRRAMHAYAGELGIRLEVIDASQDIAHEIETLKRAVGYKAARSVHKGDTIILDTGETTTYMARALRGMQGITVITNSLPVLEELEDESGITLVSSGGIVRQQSHALIGPGAEATFRELRADKAFVSGTGLSLEFGLSNPSIPEIAVKQAMIRAAQEVIVLADHTKVGVESLVKVAPLENIHALITDSGILPHDRLAFVQRGIEVLTAIAGESRSSDQAL